MKSLELLLSEFDEVLREYNLVNYERLYPPLPELDLEIFLKNLKIKSEDFRRLYKWKNGFDFNKDVYITCRIFERGTLISMNLVQQEILLNQEELTWSDTFIPFIANATGEYLLFENKEGKNFGKIFFYSPSITSAALKPVLCYDSISSLIEITIKAYQDHILQYNPDKDRLKLDVNKYFQLARKLSHGSNFWKNQND